MCSKNNKCKLDYFKFPMQHNCEFKFDIRYFLTSFLFSFYVFCRDFFWFLSFSHVKALQLVQQGLLLSACKKDWPIHLPAVEIFLGSHELAFCQYFLWTLVHTNFLSAHSQFCWCWFLCAVVMYKVLWSLCKNISHNLWRIKHKQPKSYHHVPLKLKEVLFWLDKKKYAHFSFALQYNTIQFN